MLRHQNGRWELVLPIRLMASLKAIRMIKLCFIKMIGKGVDLAVADEPLAVDAELDLSKIHLRLLSLSSSRFSSQVHDIIKYVL